MRKEDVSDSLAEQKLKVSTVKLRGVASYLLKTRLFSPLRTALIICHICEIHLKFIRPR